MDDSYKTIPDQDKFISILHQNKATNGNKKIDEWSHLILNFFQSVDNSIQLELYLEKICVQLEKDYSSSCLLPLEFFQNTQIFNFIIEFLTRSLGNNDSHSTKALTLIEFFLSYLPQSLDIFISLNFLQIVAEFFATNIFSASFKRVQVFYNIFAIFEAILKYSNETNFNIFFQFFI